MDHLNLSQPDSSLSPRRPRIATVWLAGCSGCHMSFLDLDEWLLDLAQLADVVYSPLADIKTYPENVDIVLVEGAVANEDNLEMIRQVRARTRLLISFGDCAVTGNVTALRNQAGTAEEILTQVYHQADVQPQIPADRSCVPKLLPKVLPVHQVVKVDSYLGGCPPSASAIRAALENLLREETRP